MKNCSPIFESTLCTFIDIVIRQCYKNKYYVFDLSDNETENCIELSYNFEAETADVEYDITKYLEFDRGFRC